MDTALMRWMLVGQDVLLFIVPALIIARCKSKQPLRWMGMYGCPESGIKKQESRVKVPDVLLAVVVMLVAQPAINLIASLNEMLTLPTALGGMEAWMKGMEEANAATTRLLINTQAPGAVIANILIIGVLAALSEEILFRGAIQGLFATWGKKGAPAYQMSHAAIWAAAILFSALHLQFYGFIPRMLMGAMFSYVFVWSGTLWLPVLMHAVNNTMVVVVSAIWSEDDVVSTAMEAFGRGDTWYVGVISLVLVVAVLYWMHRRLTQQK